MRFRVAALVAPWNAPLALATMEMAGALVFGNCCILKPSELTPLEFVPLLELLREAGIPDGVVGLVNGRGPVTGAALVKHPGIDVVAFIGGTKTGRHIARAAGGNLKKYVAELGGKSANIVTAECDFERALDAALVGIFSNNGQQCLAGSRILVDETIAERFIERFVERTRRLKVGDPRDMATELGPVISKAQYDRVLAFAADADVLTGGTRAEGFDKGYYVAPTVALAHDNTTRLCQEEIFARYVWRAAPVPFEPNSTWLSYGPTITLHGQGMRNPNLSSGRWTATPLDPETVCRVQQETVVEAGVLSAPRVFQGDPGQPLSVEMLPQLFYALLSGHCLWTED